MAKSPNENPQRQRDQLTGQVSRRLVKWIIGIAITVVVAIALMVGLYVRRALQPGAREIAEAASYLRHALRLVKLGGVQ